MSPQCFTRYFSCSVCRSAPHCNEKKEITKGKSELKYTMQDLKITCISAKGFFSLRIRGRVELCAEVTQIEKLERDV